MKHLATDSTDIVHGGYFMKDMFDDRGVACCTLASEATCVTWNAMNEVGQGMHNRTL